MFAAPPSDSAGVSLDHHRPWMDLGLDMRHFCVFIPEKKLNWTSKGLMKPFLASAVDEPGVSAEVLTTLQRFRPWSQCHVRACDNFLIQHAISKLDLSIVIWLIDTFDLTASDLASQRALGTRVALATQRLDILVFIDSRFGLEAVIPREYHVATLHMLYRMGHPGAPRFEDKLALGLSQEDLERHFVIAIEFGNTRALRMVLNRGGGVQHFGKLRSFIINSFRIMCENDKPYLREMIDLLDIRQHEALPIVTACIKAKKHKALHALLSDFDFPDFTFALFIGPEQPAMIVYTILFHYPSLSVSSI